MTFRLAYDEIYKRKINMHMWAFDSFKGIPVAKSYMDRHPNWKKGAMFTNIESFHKICQAHNIPREAYTLVPGFYDETLTNIPKDSPPKDIALAYVDCDMFSSTQTVLNFLTPRLKHGMIIAFDDYFCYASNQIAGERKAFINEWSVTHEWNFVRYRDYGWAGVSFVVERADLL